MPGMGGNLKFELQKGNIRKEIINADSIETRYRAGSMLYVIKDSLLGSGEIRINVLAFMYGEGIIIKMQTVGITQDVTLTAIFGGASGKKFSRDGDLGADPESSFDLKPEYCEGNNIVINKNIFLLDYKIKKDTNTLKGIFRTDAVIETEYFKKPEQPYIRASQPLSKNGVRYFLIENTATNQYNNYNELDSIYNITEAARVALASRAIINTPDSFINTLGGILSVAADGIYEDPSYLHGAVAWRMRLNAWRGAYVADPLGWHDRAVSHFASYAKSQLTEPATGAVIADTALGMARQLEKLGTSLFSSGYICRNPNGDLRPHHYDMNLVFIDQLMEHFRWTGDTAFMRQMWPLIQRHLAWEKRNFDADNDGLYDAYACIWASDALQYNGGDVTHSSAYNYKANKIAAQIAKILKENATPYEQEAEKIHNAIRFVLWLPHLGSYAEYKDNTASCNLHTAAGLWTIYHALDSEVPDAFQSYQALQYINHDIPHIPIHASGLTDTGLFVLSTTNWQPYTWSVNNVALAENLHTSLAYWQGGQRNAAFRLWKGALMESMLLGDSPGNFDQLSFYDAMRGELYRDFADPIGIAARTLVEGLFGIQPDAMHDTLNIKPGFPSAWNNASLHVPDIDINFARNDNIDNYTIHSRFAHASNIILNVPAQTYGVAKVSINGSAAKYDFESGIETPYVRINASNLKDLNIVIEWKGEHVNEVAEEISTSNYNIIRWKPKGSTILDVMDSQNIFTKLRGNADSIVGRVFKENGYGTFFVKLRKDNISWWQPVNLSFIKESTKAIDDIVVSKCEPISLNAYYNAKVTDVFKQTYMSPRSQYPTLQLPVQGIGNWCYPKVNPVISDSGFRQKSMIDGLFHLNDKISFKTATDKSFNNIIYTSLWDNYPDSVNIPLNGKGKYITLLMTGTTNPMQSQMENGLVTVRYTDGSSTSLSLRNPENWWPIEQDYFEDGYAFHLKEKPPVRIHLKDGSIYKGFAPEKSYTKLKGFSDRMIDGGAATALNIQIDEHKKLKSLTVKATASEVVIGLMAASIIH
jgi:hypothetical protein